MCCSEWYVLEGWIALKVAMYCRFAAPTRQWVLPALKWFFVFVSIMPSFECSGFSLVTHRIKYWLRKDFRNTGPVSDFLPFLLSSKPSCPSSPHPCYSYDPQIKCFYFRSPRRGQFKVWAIWILKGKKKCVYQKCLKINTNTACEHPCCILVDRKVIVVFTLLKCTVWY